MNRLKHAETIEKILQENVQPAFAVISRLDRSGQDTVDILLGEDTQHTTLASIESPAPGQSQLIVVPYNQLAERGLPHHPDESPLIALNASSRLRLTRAQASLGPVYDGTVNGSFDVDDAKYSGLVRAVIRDEISAGQGANFVIARSFRAALQGFDTETAVALFRSLLQQETGAYWTFLVHWKGHYLIGASPEKHITSDGGDVEMNPISGTYRYPATGVSGAGVLDFLNDPKETDELRMVVDEELKMMSEFCPDGVTAHGPSIKWMAKLAHTEYTLRGRSNWKVKDLLRASMFAPTIVGSPLESATGVVKKYENSGRGYYSGIVALVETDDAGRESVDSCIVIRTAHIRDNGSLRLTVGATVVRHSDPDSEVAETAAKASSMLQALSGKSAGSFSHQLPEQELVQIRRVLREKNSQLSSFWMHPRGSEPSPSAQRLKVLIIDAEDAFTQMLKQQIQALGAETTVIPYTHAFESGGYDLIVCGPGPGNPNDRLDPKVRRMEEIIGGLVEGERPFMAVCLSHQILCRLLGLEVQRKEYPNQGLQAEITHFGVRRTVGFYNAFAGIVTPSTPPKHSAAADIQVSADPYTGEIHGLLGPNFTSTQFHPESILSVDGFAILRDSLTCLLNQPELEPLKG